MSSAGDPRADLEVVLACDPAALELPQALTTLGVLQRLRGFVDRCDAAVTARVDQLHAQGSGAPAADVLTRRQRISAREASRRERRARILAEADEFSDALASGTITAEHTDVLANAATRLDDNVRAGLLAKEESLLAHAATHTPEQFARHCSRVVANLEADNGRSRNERQRAATFLTRRVDADGMHHIHGAFHPELGARIFTVLDHEIAALVAAGTDEGVDRSQVTAEALGNLVTSTHRSDRPGLAEIIVLIDEQTAVSGEQHDHTMCETDSGAALPPATVRRLLCDGTIVPVIRNAHGVVLNAGRDIRLANRDQRRALRAMYRTCAIDGCERPFSGCEMHHLIPFEHGGATDLDNLLPVCPRHHHLIHDDGWILRLDRDRTLTITFPDGSLLPPARLAA